MRFLPKIILICFCLLMASSNAAAEPPILVGLNADMSSGSAQAGEAIKRGILIAMEEINQAGGVFGRKFKLTVKNHRGIPVRGKSNMETFAADPKVIAVIGGLHTPVVLAEKKTLFDSGRLGIPYLIPWPSRVPGEDGTLPMAPNSRVTPTVRLFLIGFSAIYGLGDFTY